MTDLRTEATTLDRADPLAQWRDEFLITDPDLIYLDGNSLGRTPRRAVEALHQVVEQQWAGDLINSWWDHGWLDLPLTVGDELAPIIGARPGEVAVHDSTTVCLFQLVNVALDLVPGRNVVAVDPTEFPTDRYVVEGVSRLRGVTVSTDIHNVEAADVVVVRSLVDYRSAELHDLADETARAAAAGTTIVWDLSHAAGVVEVDLTGAGVELAAGCTYKFLNGGPGAPAFTYVRTEVQQRVEQPIWGWHAQTDLFDMDRSFTPRPGIARLLNGTPGILALTVAREGIRLTAEAGINAIAAKGRDLTDYGMRVASSFGLHVTTTTNRNRRGGHIAVRHPDAVALHKALGRRKVIVDKRDPDVLRIGMSPLTTRFVDVHDALAVLADLVSE